MLRPGAKAHIAVIGLVALLIGADARALPKALCNTCATPAAAPAPLPAWQYLDGETTTACPADYYRLDLDGTTAYELTLCASEAPGAGAAFDTYLRVRDGATCGLLAENDDHCGLQSQLWLTPPATGTYVLELSGFYPEGRPAVGTYRLAYRSLPLGGCSTCGPTRARLTPTTECQAVVGSTTGCPAPSGISTQGGEWYEVALTAGRAYTFSTCPNVPAGCGGTADFDARIELWNSACTTRLAGSDDAPACGLPSGAGLTYTPAVTGIYRLQVRGSTTETGAYTLAYVERHWACTPAWIEATGPARGHADPASCSRTEQFRVDLDPTAVPPFSGTWTVRPASGATAVPSSGTIRFTGTTGTFSSRLTAPSCGPGDFGVKVTVTGCNSIARRSAWTYALDDVTPPRFLNCPASAVLDCATPDPPPPTVTAVDNCDPAPTVSFAETRVPGPCAGSYTTQRTWTAQDCNGNVRRCVQALAHRDRTAPVITGTDAWCTWPPNHEYDCTLTSELALTVSEDCSPPARIVVVGCTSSEADDGVAPGDYPNDCIVSPDGLEFCVRSEQASPFVARTYTVIGLAIDACGNRSTPRPVAVITVPIDDGSGHPECRTPDSGLDRHF